MIGDQFDVGNGEICGVFLSVREHDVISVWNKTGNDQEIRDKIRDKLKTVLQLPPKTFMEYKVHAALLEKNNGNQQQQQQVKSSEGYVVT